MKILLASSGSGSRGGGEIFLVYLGRALVARGHSVVTWMPTHSRMDELASQCSEFSEVVRGGYTNTYDYRSRSFATVFNSQASREIGRHWLTLKPDVIHINKQNLEDGLDLLRAARFSGLPSICTIHLTQTARYLRARGALLRDFVAWSALRRFEGIYVAVQEARRQELASFLRSESKTRTIFNGVPPVHVSERDALRIETRAQMAATNETLLVIGVGRLVAQKKPFVFLELARSMHNQQRHMKFIWVGDGELANEWNAAVRRLGLSDVVSCVGWKSDVRPYLAAADLLLHTAEYEGLPFALIEAMSAGVPCAISRSVAVELPFLNDENAIFYDRQGHLEKYVSSAEALRVIGESGRVMVSQRFSDDGMAAAYEKVYVEQITGTNLE